MKRRMGRNINFHSLQRKNFFLYGLLITGIMGFIAFSGCSQFPANWKKTAEVVSLNVSTDPLSFSIEGYPSFEWELFTNPLFEGNPYRNGLSSTNTISIPVTGPPNLEQGKPYYLRIRSSRGEWQPYETSNGTPKFFLYNPGILGTVTNPYKIQGKEELIALSNNDLPWSAANGNYILGSDIDLSGVTWKPIGMDNLIPPVSTNHFSGSFNGNGHKISGLEKFDPNYQYAGFFGYAEGATISNITLEVGSLSGSENTLSIGGLIGTLTNETPNPSSISNCSVSGISIEETTGASPIGGLIGKVSTTVRPTEIRNCYTNIQVSGKRYTGGLIGLTSGSWALTITNCYAAGDILYTGTGVIRSAGGLIGIWTAVGGSSMNWCLALNKKVVNINGSSGALFYVGDNVIMGTGNYIYYNKYINSPGGSSELAFGQTALPINPFTMNQSTIPFNNWDFNNSWKWDNSINRPVLVGNKL